MREKQHQDGSDFFIGARLAARRQKIGIPIEKAAKDTRIPVTRLRAIESDDFSSFSHPTYARLFLTDYANYLGIPLEDIREYLPGVKGLGSADNAYLNVLLAKPGFLQGEQFKSIRRLLFAVGTLLGLLLLVGVGIYSWRAWKKIERVQPPAPPAEALPTPVATPSPVTAPVAFVEPAPTPEIEATPEATPAKVQTSDSIRIQPPLTPAATPVGKSAALPHAKSSPTPVASATPLTSLPPFQPAPRSKRTP